MVHGKNENVPVLTECVLRFGCAFTSAFNPFCTLHYFEKHLIFFFFMYVPNLSILSNIRLVVHEK